MCGLAGFWRPGGGSADALRDQARRMGDTLRHRGPDDGGEWVDAAAGVGFGFRRLAIVDLSPAGHQPMVSSDGRFVVEYNGEIYNYRDLRAGLEAEGVRFRGSSDTEVIVELCARRGVRDMLQAVWGMFAMAIWDTRQRVLWLTRDRLGKKPLYYGKASDGAWIFGSELKSLRAYAGCPTTIDRGAVASLLRYACIPAPASIYTGIAKLPPGCLALLREGHAPAIEPYWRARDVVESAVRRRTDRDEREALDEGEALLRDTVRRRMVADVPVGAFLSGGIDSSLIVALMQAESTQRVRTFSIGFTEPDYNEADIAKQVAAHLGTDHCEFYVRPEEALEVVPTLGRLYDEPFADSSQIPTYAVSALARKHVTVALTGDGGDEMFGGYPRYLMAARAWRRITQLPSLPRHLAAGALNRMPLAVFNALYAASQMAVPAHARQPVGEKQRRLAQFLATDDEDDLYEILISQWAAPELAVPGAGEPVPWWRGEARHLAVPTVAERAIFSDTVFYLPDDILVKVDRASMGVSLELRAPLLDHRVLEYAWALPQSFRIRDGRGKWLLRRLLERHVPSVLMDRPKTGFSLPVGRWLRGPLRDWAESLLSPTALASSGVFDGAAVRAVWQRHLAGDGDKHLQLWPVLMFQVWHAEWHRAPQ